MADQTTCDYVIVGAGSAGCVLAHRLSERGAGKIVVLEAGGEAPRGLLVPGRLRHHAQAHLRVDLSDPEPALGNRRIALTSAHIVGGASSINAMIYLRGRPEDYDAWQTTGNHGWSFADVLPYFMRSEDQARGASMYHGVGGPMAVSDPRFVSPESEAFVRAWSEQGIPQNDDFNGPRQEGAGIFQLTQRRGTRVSAASAFLEPALAGGGVTLITGARATRVILRGLQAVAVEYLAGGRLHRLEVQREVLLCLGALGSPLLLLRSGIGPADELRALGIEAAVDLPGVGNNLQDHVGVPVVFERRVPRPMVAPVWRRVDAAARYALARRGPWASNGIEAGAFVRASPRASLPDIECLLHGAEDEGLVFEACLLATESTGSVRLRSADPLAPPRLATNVLSTRAEIKALAEGVAMCRALGRTRALAPYVRREVAPGSDWTPGGALNYIAATAASCKHYVGTCRMGDDAGGVVDRELRVRGFEGLRVVDASVMPRLPAAHTNAPTIMVAERAADFILDDTPDHRRRRDEEAPA